MLLDNVADNVAMDNPEFYEKRIKFCHEFVELLPDSDEFIIENMRRAEAESYFLIGNLGEGEKAEKLYHEALTKEIEKIDKESVSRKIRRFRSKKEKFGFVKKFGHTAKFISSSSWAY